MSDRSRTDLAAEACEQLGPEALSLPGLTLRRETLFGAPLLAVEIAAEEAAARLGKLYRVSRRDLDAYLARSKREAAGGGGTCSVCGTHYRSRGSLRHVCSADGCEEPICFDCWARLGVRACPKHAEKH